jgi:hypothetical protein
MSHDMFDDPRSHEADDLSLQAELLERKGEHADARELYLRAAALEEALAREAPIAVTTGPWGAGDQCGVAVERGRGTTPGDRTRRNRSVYRVVTDPWGLG